MEKITSMRDLQRRMADDVEEYLTTPEITDGTRQMCDIRLAIQTDDVAILITEYLEYQLQESGG